jgi:hypothetical protein
MADDPLVAVAKAVKAGLQAAEFSQPFEVRRAYRPTFNLKRDSAIVVTVSIGPYSEAPMNRGRNQIDVTILVTVQKKLKAQEVEEIDGLIFLVREIRRYLRRPFDEANASFQALPDQDLYSGEHLIEHKLFTSVSSATYRTTDDPTP